MGRVLAFDFGLKRTGLAETDDLQMIASPLTTVETKDLIPFIQDYLSKHAVDIFVLGLPTRLDGSDAHVTREVYELKTLLEKKFPHIKVELQNEYLTSKKASMAMVEGGLSKSKRREKGMIDKVAAALILQSWLDQRGSIF